MVGATYERRGAGTVPPEDLRDLGAVTVATVLPVRLAPRRGPDGLASTVAARGLVLLRARCVPAPAAPGPAPR